MHPSYARVVESTEPNFQTVLCNLPYAIGITDNPSGGWEDFTKQRMIYDMPLIIAENALIKSSISEQLLDNFNYAHHCAGFFGLTTDLLVDGQAKQIPFQGAVLKHLKDAWYVSLSDGLGDSSKAQIEINKMVKLWATGIRQEKKTFRKGKLLPGEYVQIIRNKTRWLSLASLCMIELSDHPSLKTDFIRCFDLMFCGMQCRDDALDALEDKTNRGNCYPDCLSITCGALFRVGIILLQQCVDLARSSGFNEFAQYLSDYKESAFLYPPEGNGLLDCIAGGVFSSLLVNYFRISSYP